MQVPHEQFPDLPERLAVPIEPADLGGKAADALGDVSDHFELGEIDVIDHGRFEIDVDDLFAAVFHEEGGFFV